ncbi:F-box/LRR-repeat protein 13-like [Gossypium australe]|uniref:F-box/LRR-repeat protein 13-like n=1 Tax=Gossypium australe TaxID=47621 RepID=A0A5B6UWL5_9ROSI|nr:F-box/LRR-repeat protein 13-like [Gossypium australe]
MDLVMQFDETRMGMINPECLPFSSNMEFEQVNFMGNNSRTQNNPYRNNYRMEESSKCFLGGQGNQRSQPLLGFQQPYQREKKPNLEEMLTKFIFVSETKFQNIEMALRNQQTSVQGLENQISQHAKLISERQQVSLPSNTAPP